MIYLEKKSHEVKNSHFFFISAFIFNENTAAFSYRYRRIFYGIPITKYTYGCSVQHKKKRLEKDERTYTRIKKTIPATGPIYNLCEWYAILLAKYVYIHISNEPAPLKNERKKKGKFKFTSRKDIGKYYVANLF